MSGNPGDEKRPGKDPEDDLQIIRDLGAYPVSPGRRPPPSRPPERETRSPKPPLQRKDPEVSKAPPVEIESESPAARSERPPEEPGLGVTIGRRKNVTRSAVFSVDWREQLGLSSRKTPSEPLHDPQAEEPRPERARVERSPGTRRAAIGGALVAAVATVLMVLKIEPFHTWYYLFAWYPFLLVVNHGAATRAPEHSLFRGRVGAALSLLAWSVPAWLFFEIWNFRLENWYYVGVPHELWARRLGVVLSFATVLPGLFLLEEIQKVRGLFEHARTPSFSLGRRAETGIFLAGLVSAALVLAFPARFFWLVWAVPVLLVDPWLHRRGADSLAGDLSRGSPGRILRLLLAGLGCGLFWESANYLAGGKWIYTVPGFEDGKLFEMPLLGFLGFAPFALCCWTLARALVERGWMAEWEIPAERPPELRRRPRGPERVLVVAAAAGLSLLVLEVMDRRTVDSSAPRIEDVPGIPDGIAEYARSRGDGDVRALLERIESGDFYVPGRSSAEAIALLRDRSRLVLLRGIGTANAERLVRVGVNSIEDLAAREPESLVAALAALSEPGWHPRERRVETWIRAAQAH